MWAAAALFHLAGNSRDALVASPTLAVLSLGLGVAAALTLLAPQRLWRVVLLCALVPLTAWFEAPVVGNHWVLAAAVSLALLVAVVLARGSHDPALVWAWFAPVARLSLLVAYSFAAFAKLNTDFLDPVVSCAVYYHNQLVGSWGLDFLAVASGSQLGRLLGIGAALTELTVAVTLALPRLRRVGLVLAVSFHWLLAMDLAQHFWDFSSVLFAGFLLFLDDQQVSALRATTAGLSQRVRRRRRLWSGVVVGLSATVTLLAVLPVPLALDVVLVLLGHLAWWAYGTLVVMLVVLVLRAPPARTVAGGLAAPRPLLYVIPALVLLNGLTPYLELKTGWGWNMYSNLRTVAGESNHLLVPRTLDLSGLQRDQVRIVDSSDPVLRTLRDEQYVLTYSEFREYAHEHPDVSATYKRGGLVHVADRLGGDPAGQGDVSALSVRVQSFRVIDDSGSERCQPSFSAAR
jgi:hypothetical protein